MIKARRQGRAVPRAALRVLRRLRGLRRDALHQAADAAYGDRLHDRQRDGLLVDLRRQSANDAVFEPIDGRGPAWSNSLFEDNAEFGFGMRVWRSTSTWSSAGALRALACDSDRRTWSRHARRPIRDRSRGSRSNAEARRGPQGQAGDASKAPEARRLENLADYLVKKSVWIIGGDGWAYDIGYGGLDHVLATGPKCQYPGAGYRSILQHRRPGLEVHADRAHRRSSRWAARRRLKKDLGLIAMTYGSVYVARVAMGAKDLQCIQALSEAESFPGTSIIIAYSPCISHGYGMQYGLEQQKLAVDSGHWPLFRYDPRKAGTGEAPLKLDSAAPKITFKSYVEKEIRYKMLEREDPVHAKELQEAAQAAITSRFEFYQHLAKFGASGPKKT